MQIPTTDFCLKQRLPTTPGMWDEEESDYVINGAPVTVMLPPLTPKSEDEPAEVRMIAHDAVLFRVLGFRLSLGLKP